LFAHTKRYFATAGPHIWNNSPGSLQDKEVSCTEFTRQLKTFISDGLQHIATFFDYCTL